MRTKSLSVSKRRLSSTERLALLDEYHRGRLTQREFAARHGVGLATLGKWLRRERELAKTPRPLRPRFAEVPLGQVLGAARWAAEIVRPDGWTVRLAADASAVLVEQLLRPC